MRKGNVFSLGCSGVVPMKPVYPFPPPTCSNLFIGNHPPSRTGCHGMRAVGFRLTCPHVLNMILWKVLCSLGRSTIIEHAQACMCQHVLLRNIFFSWLKLFFILHLQENGRTQNGRKERSTNCAVV